MIAPQPGAGVPASAEDVLRLHAETLVVARRRVDVAVVQATARTAVHQTAVDETLTSEDVVIERVACGWTVDAVPDIREEGDTTILPVVEEVLVRQLVLKEEVRIRRVARTERLVETVSLRRQHAEITRTEIDARKSGPAMTDALPSVASLPSPINEGYLPMSYAATNETSETIVAVFDTPAHAELAVADLKLAGLPESAISVHARDTTTTTMTDREPGFWAGLFGGEPDHDTAVYDHSMANGATVVTVRSSQAHAGRAMEILESHAPVDLDERAESYGLTSSSTMNEPVVGSMATGAMATGAMKTAAMTTDTGAMGRSTVGTAATGVAADDSIRLSEERLSVGKRLVNMGGTRIRRFVVETPVEESVSLHEERVTIERRPVTDGKVVTGADFTEKTIEMRETAEEAVVSKQAFVTEEIALRKTASDRVETVKDTVRKEDVAIEKIPATATTTTTTTTGTVRPAKI